MLYVPRSAWWGNGPPVNNDGVTPRPYIGHFTNGVAVHYTGGPKRTRNYTQDPVTLMREEQAWARSAGKSFEYNFKILPRFDGSAVVCEYAGLHMAAHAGETGKYEHNNSTRCAIQFAIGVDNHPSYSNYDPTRPVAWEPLTDAMVEAFRWLRADLLGLGAVTSLVTPDRELPGRATSCPGEAVVGRWDDLLAADPTEPDLPPEDDMANIAIIRPRGIADQFALVPIASADQARRMGIDGQQPIVVDVDNLDVLEAQVGYPLTATKDGN